MSETNDETVIQINEAEIIQALKNGGIKTTDLAKSLGVTQPIVKQLLVEKFGDNIEFRRGRKGGAFWIGE